MTLEPFAAALSKRGIELFRDKTDTLQINVGRLCNQVCRHCHLEAGPDSPQVMQPGTAHEIIEFAKRCPVEIADITGGAPEMNPVLTELIVELASLVPRVMLRSNLTAVKTCRKDFILDLCRTHQVVIVASFPSLNPSQTESQRGKGVWEMSIETLRKLNSIGYGQPGSGLELNLVSNPSGAFLPPSQTQSEKKFRNDLYRKFGIVFNHFFTFANVPLGRFRRWLIESGNLEDYMRKLAERFNPCAVKGLMCRTMLSVSWDGYLYDCDFNLAEGLFLGGRKMHISQMEGAPALGLPIAVSDHCYACTAGSGFT